MLLLKLAAVPAVVWLASWAGRRWGHRAAGLISGLPVISGPILLFVALDAPAAFTAEASWATMGASPAVAMHCLAYAWIAQRPLGGRWHPLLALLGAWCAYVGSATLLSALVIRGPLGAVLSIGLMLAATALMPAVRNPVAIPRIPASEILIRMLAALIIATVVTLGAQTLGTRVSGILLAFPITASVLPLFTLALYGAQATARLLAGFVTGLVGFALYFYVFAELVVPAGIAIAALVGAAASVVVVRLIAELQVRWARRLSR
jgi:hypothetical protein